VEGYYYGLGEERPRLC